MANAVLPILHDRNWALLVAENEEDLFICSDHPVILHWMDEAMSRQPVGLGLSGTGVYIPLSCSLGLLGVFEDSSSIIKADTKQVASYNSLTLMASYEQVYSREESFRAINPAGEIVEVAIAELAADRNVVLTKRANVQQVDGKKVNEHRRQV